MCSLMPTDLGKKKFDQRVEEFDPPRYHAKLDHLRLDQIYPRER